MPRAVAFNQIEHQPKRRGGRRFARFPATNRRWRHTQCASQCLDGQIVVLTDGAHRRLLGELTKLRQFACGHGAHPHETLGGLDRFPGRTGGSSSGSGRRHRIHRPQDTGGSRHQSKLGTVGRARGKAVPRSAKDPPSLFLCSQKAEPTGLRGSMPRSTVLHRACPAPARPIRFLNKPSPRSASTRPRRISSIADPSWSSETPVLCAQRRKARSITTVAIEDLKAAA